MCGLLTQHVDCQAGAINLVSVMLMGASDNQGYVGFVDSACGLPGGCNQPCVGHADGGK
jgi:hypothetical protein